MSYEVFPIPQNVLWEKEFVEPETGEILSMCTQLKRLVEFVYHKAIALGTEDYLKYALTMIEGGNEAELQIDLYKKHNGDLRALELELAKQTIDYVE